MSPRLYATALIGLSIGVLLLVLLTNVLTDPEGVLGTGVTGEPSAPNFVYRALRTQQRDAGQSDGLLFGSSRAPAIPLDELSRRTGSNFANVAFAAGMITDHEPLLRYLLRMKQQSGRPLRTAFLLLDLDVFGTPAPTNRSLQTMLPPELTGDSRIAFNWRYLSAIQYGPWRSAILDLLDRRRGTGPGQALGSRLPSSADFEMARAAAAAPGGVAAPPPAEQDVHVAHQTTPRDLALHLGLLRQFVKLCRQHEVRLIVAAAPLNRRNAMLYGAEELTRRRQLVAAVVPAWDFGSPDWLSDRPELWSDDRHFMPPVGKMMLDAIFDARDGSIPSDFGQLYGG
jgi:hypothetical protein